MTIPTITPPITPPNRVNGEDDYDQKTYDFRMSEIQMAEELVITIDAFNAAVAEVDADATAVEIARQQVVLLEGQVSDTKGDIDNIKTQIDLQEAAVVASTGIDVSTYNIGDLLQVVDNGAGGKTLAMSGQRLENSGPFTGTTPSLDIASKQYHHGTLTGNATFTFDVSGFGAAGDHAGRHPADDHFPGVGKVG